MAGLVPAILFSVDLILKGMPTPHPAPRSRGAACRRTPAVSMATSPEPASMVRDAAPSTRLRAFSPRYRAAPHHEALEGSGFPHLLARDPVERAVERAGQPVEQFVDLSL